MYRVSLGQFYTAPAETVFSISPSKDNTPYENPAGSLSNATAPAMDFPHLWRGRFGGSVSREGPPRLAK